MKPWPWPTNSVTIRPVLGLPRRSAGGTAAALRGGAVFRAAPLECAATLPARLRPPAMRAAAAAAEPAAAVGLWASFIDGETAPADLCGVQFADGSLRLFVCAHLDESEPARTAGHLIAHDRHRFNGAGAGEQFLEFGFSQFVRQI